MKSPQIAAAQTVIIYIPDRLVWGAQLVVRGPSNALDATPPPLREIGQQEDLLANLMLHVFTYCWFEMTWK